MLLLDELTTFLDGEDQRGVLEAVRSCVGGPDQVKSFTEFTLSLAVSPYQRRFCITLTHHLTNRRSADVYL